MLDPDAEDLDTLTSRRDVLAILRCQARELQQHARRLDRLARKVSLLEWLAGLFLLAAVAVTGAGCLLTPIILMLSVLGY